MIPLFSPFLFHIITQEQDQLDQIKKKVAIIYSENEFKNMFYLFPEDVGEQAGEVGEKAGDVGEQAGDVGKQADEVGK